jgi:D-alanyl-D-alanine carboxypeptidase/D-alanyl-D-alanine-endopeptidase (penicillin-binding protein 4)
VPKQFADHWFTALRCHGRLQFAVASSTSPTSPNRTLDTERTNLAHSARKRLLALLLPFLAAAAPAATKPAPAPVPLPAAIGREVDVARKSARSMGVHVVDLAEKREVYGFEADQTRILASNTKLFSTAAALSELGPEFQFETRFLQRGEIQGDTLVGDLAIVGGGDPNLSGRFYKGDSYAPFRPWARELVARGIRKVGGDLHLVNGIFAEPRVHPDWPRDQLTAWYEAPVDALSFNDNCVLVRVRPGVQPGQLARPTTVPAMDDYFRFRNSARTVAGRKGSLIVGREAASDQLVIGGTIGVSSGQVDVWVTVHDPQAYFAAAVRGALREEGIEIAGANRYDHGLPEGDWQQAWVHASPLSDTLAVTNKRSQNFYAESLAKLLGWKKLGLGTWPNAVEAISTSLGTLGVDRGGFQLADGSGLSRANTATPKAVTALLEKMYFHAYGREFLQSLPYSGEEGLSWRRRLATAPYKGNVFAKTGTLNGVSTLSGYARAASGRVYAFSILMNQVRGNAHGAQDRIVRALVDRG